MKNRRDFVAYYTKTDAENPHEQPTVVVPRTNRWRLPLLVGGVVATLFLVGAIAGLVTSTPEPHSAVVVPVVPVAPVSVPTSVTTITSMDVVVDVPAPAPKKPSTKGVAPIKTEPRADFIRNM